MSLVIVKTVAEQPMTDANLEEMDRIGLPCLQAHGVIWLHSLLSSDRYQMICYFDAPDAESVRSSYAKLGVQKRAIWSGELIQMAGTQPDLTERYVSEAHYPTLSDADWNNVRQTFSQCCTEFEVNWLCSYLSLDRTRVIHELAAPNTETIRDAYHKFDIPHDSVWSAQRLMP
jgi:Protein of unknown function (DUF4242)